MLQLQRVPALRPYTIQSSSSGTGASLDAYSGDGVELSFDVLSSNQYSLTGSLNVTTPTESPSSDPLKVNPMYEVYNDIPNDITFDGSSSLSFKINGEIQSYNLTDRQKDVYAALDQELQESIGGDNCLVCPASYSASLPVSAYSTSSEQTQKPVSAMTDNEIKKWLEQKGYKVKKLPNHRFELTRKFKRKNDPNAAPVFSTISIFNATTKRMESGFTTYQDGKKMAEHLIKEDKQAGKTHLLSKIIRSDGNGHSQDRIIDIVKKQNNK